MTNCIEQYVPKEDLQKLQEELVALKEAAMELVLEVEESYDLNHKDEDNLPTWSMLQAKNRMRELLGMECWT